MKITDEIIKQLFKPKNAKYILRKSARQKLIENNNELKNYLDNRYEDMHDYDEIIYCILNDYKAAPKCSICGKNIKFKNITEGYRDVLTCGDLKCRMLVTKQTTLLKYGVDNPAKSKEIYEKIKHTNLQKYGVDNPAKAKSIKEKIHNTISSRTQEQKDSIKTKIKNTMLERYGVTNNLHIPEVEQKIKQKYQEKYGVDYGLSSSVVRDKIRNTSLLKYGVDNPAKAEEIREKQSLLMLNPEIQKKINDTKKLRKTYNTSKVEQQFKQYLEQYYKDDFEYQYRSNDYPFNCDFYIKSLNLFIEIQASWVHGKHPFNENNKDDLDKLNYMLSKHTKYYDNAVIVWSQRDVMKRNYAHTHDLCYLEIFSNDINVCIQEFNKKIKSLG